jgi:hypothetical protein
MEFYSLRDVQHFQQQFLKHMMMTTLVQTRSSLVMYNIILKSGKNWDFKILTQVCVWNVNK